jgi:hypothetical protein
MEIKLSSKFCPFCSNDKAVDGSYQEIGCFAVMERLFWECSNMNERWFHETWECSNCGHEEDIEDGQ